MEVSHERQQKTITWKTATSNGRFYNSDGGIDGVDYDGIFLAGGRTVIAGYIGPDRRPVIQIPAGR